MYKNYQLQKSQQSQPTNDREDSQVQGRVPGIQQNKQNQHLFAEYLTLN